jgi:hypothetical protein
MWMDKERQVSDRYVSVFFSQRYNVTVYLKQVRRKVTFGQDTQCGQFEDGMLKNMTSSWIVHAHCSTVYALQ